MEISSELLVLLRDIFTVLEVVTAIVASLFYWKYNSGFFKYFLFFLWYIVFHEAICIVSRTYFKDSIHANSFFFSNIFQLIQFSFYMILYSKSYKNYLNSKIVIIFFYVYLFLFIFNCFYLNIFYYSFINASIFGSIAVTIAIILYFIELINSDLILKIQKILLFWISFAILIHFAPMIPFKVIEKYYYNSVEIPYIYLSKFILVFTMNILLIIGFICSQKNQKG
jgi:hypothetical protein